MKRIKLLGILLVSATSFIGCSDDNQQTANKEQNTTQQNVQHAARPVARYTDAEVTAFKNLLLEYHLDNLSNQWLDAVKDSDFENAMTLQVNIKSKVDAVKIRWNNENFEDMVIYIGEIEKIPAGSHDGNPCTRNRDGSTYDGTCTWLGKLVVAIKALPCQGYLDNAYGPGVDTDTRKYLEDQFGACVQDKICSTC